jgi:LysM repeat protein
MTFFSSLWSAVALSVLLLLPSCAPMRDSSRESLSYRELSVEVEDFRHRLDNYAVEFQIMEGKVNSQDEEIKDLRDHWLNSQSKENKGVSSKIQHIDTALSSLGKVQKGVLEDLQNLKTHANDTTRSLSQSKNHLREFEEKVGHIERNVEQKISEVKKSVEMLIRIIEQNESPKKNQASYEYKVKKGDSLERIAKKYNVTIKKIKEANNLKSDLIVVGQKLHVPQ